MSSCLFDGGFCFPELCESESMWCSIVDFRRRKFNGTTVINSVGVTVHELQTFRVEIRWRKWASRANVLPRYVSEGSFWLCPFGRRLLNGNRDLASLAVCERHGTYLRKMLLLTDLPMFPSLKWRRFQTSRANIHRWKVNMLCDLYRHRTPVYQPLAPLPAAQVGT